MDLSVWFRMRYGVRRSKVGEIIVTVTYPESVYFRR